MPYLSIAERIMGAFHQGVAPDPEEMRWILNPLRYLIDVGKERIGEIVLVSGSNEKAPEPGKDGDDSDSESDRRYRWQMKFKRLEREQLDEAQRQEIEELRSYGERAKIEISVLDPNEVVSVSLRDRPAIWEFLPYNDRKFLSGKEETFLREICAKSADLFRNRGGERTKLKEIKKIYEEIFGSSNNNHISLFLYGGLPINLKSAQNIRVCSKLMGNGEEKPLVFEMLNVSILYTGDGNLKQRRYEKFEKFLHRDRIDRICVLQVPHHGSKYNWHKGLANKIDPCISVFCAGSSNRHGHPHSSVFEDFELTKRVWVNEYCKFPFSLCFKYVSYSP